MTIAESGFASQAGKIPTAQMQWKQRPLLMLAAGQESPVSWCPCLSSCPIGFWHFQAVVPAFARHLIEKVENADALAAN